MRTSLRFTIALTVCGLVLCFSADAVAQLGGGYEPTKLVVYPDTLVMTPIDFGYPIGVAPPFPQPFFITTNDGRNVPFRAVTKNEWIHISPISDTVTSETPDSILVVVLDGVSDTTYGVIEVTSECSDNIDSVIVCFIPLEPNGLATFNDTLFIANDTTEQGDNVALSMIPDGDSWSYGGIDGGDICPAPSIYDIKVIYDSSLFSIDSIIDNHIYFDILETTLPGIYEIDAYATFIRGCMAWSQIGGGTEWNYDVLSSTIVIPGSITVTERIIQELTFDIKPGSCPNPLNMKRNSGKSVLPTAILGTDDFDVHDIDPSTLSLLGVSPVRWSYEDVSTPVGEAEDDCDCTSGGPDGYEDLALKFPRSAIIEALEQMEGGPSDNGRLVRESLSAGNGEHEVTVSISGELTDGTAIEGHDCLRLLHQNKSMPMAMPQTVSLGANQPNPFNPTTSISYTLASAGRVTLEVFNILGRRVAVLVSELREAGEHTATWDAGGAASGVYFYRLQTADYVKTRRMMYLK